jgi:hypothetical protein
MPQLRNTNPVGHADVPLLGRQGGPVSYYVCPDGEYCVERNGTDHEHELVTVDEPGRALAPGEVFEVTDEQAKALLTQPDNFEPVADAMDVMTVAELHDLAAERDIDVTGLTKKADLVAAIKKG